jgi:hypothetical protein
LLLHLQVGLHESHGMYLARLNITIDMFAKKREQKGSRL